MLVSRCVCLCVLSLASHKELTFACTHICIHVYVHICLSRHMSEYVCIGVHIYIYMSPYAALDIGNLHTHTCVETCLQEDTYSLP